MQTALGLLGWRPAEFWGATVIEFYAAIDAYRIMHPVKDELEPPTEDEMAKLLEKYG